METGRVTGADRAGSAATRTRMLTATGLLRMDLAVFAAASVFRPRTMGMINWHNPLGRFVNSRERWDIAWDVLPAAVLSSAGVFLLMEALAAFRGIRKTSDPTRGQYRTPHLIASDRRPSRTVRVRDHARQCSARGPSGP
jgi:hypothetical protein